MQGKASGREKLKIRREKEKGRGEGELHLGGRGVPEAQDQVSHS